MKIGERIGIPSIDRFVFVFFSAVVLTYVIVRAASIPWIHDESTTIYWYVERGEFLPYVALWDAGNHFLSTAIGILAHKLWGLSLLGSRIGSILAFVLFAWAVWRIGELITDRSLRWIGWISLLTCPFLLDFFSLFRGYALGMAFWLIAIDGVIRYFNGRKPIHLIQLLVALFLADLAVLSLVPLWALIIGLIGFQEAYKWLKDRSNFPWRIALIWIGLGIIPLLIGLLLAWEMRRRGLLYHGTTEGFFEVTVSSLSKYVLGSDNVLAVVIICAILSIAIFSIYKGRGWDSIASLLGLLLFADVLMRIGMAWILKVNYPEDRAALHMVPLAILFVVFSADRIIERKWARLALAMPLVFLPIRTILSLNTDHTLLWPEQSVPTHFLEKIGSLQKGSVRPLMIGAYHQLSFAIPYAARLNGIDLQPPDVIGFPSGVHDVRIVDDRFIESAMEGYRSIDRSPGNGLHLLLRDVPLNMNEIDRFSVEPSDPSAEFIELWRPGSNSINANLRIEVSTSIASDAPFLELVLVASQKKDGTSLHYNSIPLSHFRPKWSGEAMKLIINLPVMQADEKVIYFWNGKKVPIEMSTIEVTVHEITDRPL